MKYIYTIENEKNALSFRYISKFVFLMPINLCYLSFFDIDKYTDNRVFFYRLFWVKFEREKNKIG